MIANATSNAPEAHAAQALHRAAANHAAHHGAEQRARQQGERASGAEHPRGGPSAMVSLSPEAAARYAEAANQVDVDAAAPAQADAPPAAADDRPARPAAMPRAPGVASPMAAARSSSASSLDVADTNEDGQVTVKEQQAYDVQWVAKQAVRWAAQQHEATAQQPKLAGDWASARYGAMQAMAA